jgi:O-Antigen ligase
MPRSERLRLVLVLALATLTLLASTGIVARHIFSQPTTLKYLVTVFAPLLLIFVCLAKNPLRLLVGATIITAPWDLNVTLAGVRISPVEVLLALAAFVALLTSRKTIVRATATGSIVLVAVALLLPSLAIGREQPHYVTWIASTLVAGWLAMLVARQPGGLRLLLSLLVIAAAFQSLIVFYEYSHHANLNLYSSEVNQAVSKTFYYNFGSDFRPSGTLPDPDSLGNLLAVAFPLALVLALSESRVVLRLAWGACAAMIVIALTLTFSRASWIGAAAGAVVVVALLPPRARLPALAGTGALLAMTVIVGLSIGGTHLSERFASIENPTARTNRTARDDEQRKQIWSAALAIASANPAVGTGMGRLQEHLSEHLGASSEAYHAQSVYFQFLAQSGVLGLLALALLIGHSAMGVVAGLRRERLLMAGVAGAIIAMLLTWTTDTTARYTGISVVLGFLLAAAMAYHRQSTQGMRVVNP